MYNQKSNILHADNARLELSSGGSISDFVKLLYISLRWGSYSAGVAVQRGRPSDGSPLLFPELPLSIVDRLCTDV